MTPQEHAAYAMHHEIDTLYHATLGKAEWAHTLAANTGGDMFKDARYAMDTVDPLFTASVGGLLGRIAGGAVR